MPDRNEPIPSLVEDIGTGSPRGTGYPKTKPNDPAVHKGVLDDEFDKENQMLSKQLAIVDHFITRAGVQPQDDYVSEFALERNEHSPYDQAPFQIALQDQVNGAGNGSVGYDPYGNKLRKANELDQTFNENTNGNAPEFRGALTHVNPYDDPETEKMIIAGQSPAGLESYEMERSNETSRKPPVSPLHPFTRMNDPSHQYMGQQATLRTYNRAKIPIADNMFRKGIRHIFITRPECYIMRSRTSLTDQANNDEDFYSCAVRMPHILRLLSPVYVTGTIGSSIFAGAQTNWNYLLSNQVQGMSTAATSLTIQDNVPKSTEGFTVTPAMHVESRQGATLELTFQDTKNLEVFELLRMWMLYAYKRKKGVFAPAFNNYADTDNDFMKPGTVDKNAHLHPYDRAIDYGATLFDVITNESGTKILYWCKYYGIYPTSCSPSLSNESNGPITSMTTSAVFKYHYRLENNFKNLIEFNYNAGLTDNIGNVIKEIETTSLPFLLRREYNDPFMPNYLGAAGMFVGSPYIVLANTQIDPTVNDGTVLQSPFLRFAPIVDDNEFDGILNLGIINHEKENVGKTISTGSVSAGPLSEAADTNRNNSDAAAAEAAAEEEKVVSMENWKSGISSIADGSFIGDIGSTVLDKIGTARDSLRGDMDDILNILKTGNRNG